MEINCAGCGCLVEQGVRVRPCGTAGCCCLELPLRTDQYQAVAARIQAAFTTKNLNAFGALLAADARWGDDDAMNKCRSRSDVLRTFERVMGEGVDGRIIDTTVGPYGIACRLEVDWPDPDDRARGQRFFHAYIIRDGLIAEIRRYDDQASALDAIGIA